MIHLKIIIIDSPKRLRTTLTR